MCAIPKTGHISKNLKECGDQIWRLRKAVPKMILQVGGSISFAPEPDEEAKFQSYDSRHKLAEIDPKPDQVTISYGTSLYDLTALHPVDAFEGTRFANPRMSANDTSATSAIVRKSIHSAGRRESGPAVDFAR